MYDVVTMPTVRRADPTAMKAKQYLFIKRDIEEQTARLTVLKADLMRMVEAKGEPDDKGSQYLDLPYPIEVGDRSYSTLKREHKSGSISFNEEAALALAEKLGIRERVVQTVEVIDQNEFYVLNQEGVISDEQLDGLFEQKPDFWAFIPMVG